MTQQTQQQNTNQNTTANQAQQSQTAPWIQSQRAIYNLLNPLNNANTGMTPAQTQAINSLVTASNGLPNFGGQSADVTSGLLGGDPTGLLKSGNTAFQNLLDPIANASLDPTKNPLFMNAINSAEYDANQANQSLFSGAGRTGSGAQSAALGQTYARDIAPLFANQYNQDVTNRINAGSQMFGANYNTAGAITGNQNTGLAAAQNQPNIALAPQLAALQAAQTQYNLAPSNIGTYANLTLPFAGLGGQSSGTGSGTSNMTGQTNTTITPSMLQDIMGVSSILGGNLGLFGSAGQGGSSVAGKGLGFLGL